MPRGLATRRMIGMGLLGGGGSREINRTCPAITPTVGAELWDAPAQRFDGGTYHWVKYGNNTIENDTNALKITYVDNATGAYDSFADGSDLSSNLTVNSWYQYQVDSKVNAGSSVQITACDGTIEFVLGAQTNSAQFTTMSCVFRALHATGGFARFGGMGAGEIVWLDNPSLKPITNMGLKLGARVQQSGSYQCKPTVTDLTAAGMEICKKDENNKLLMIVQRMAQPTGTDKAELWKISNGIWTSVASGTITYGAGAILKAIVNGTSVSLYYGGAQVGTTQTVSELATMGLEVWGWSNYSINSVGEVNTDPNLA